ncbi:reverse transcriptase domain-containing protein [Tanacetum coccineum]
MSTREQHTPTIPASAVRNTRGRSGPQGLEEPTSDEVLRELCDKNYHQLLSLIAEKIQKEKEQQDKLNAVKAHLLYDDESGRNPRNREESHYSESKTPTARTEPRRKHGSKHSRSPSLIASVGGKNKAHPHALTVATVLTLRGPKCNQGSIITRAHCPEEIADTQRVKTAREVIGNPNQRGTGQTPTKMISLSLGGTGQTPRIRHFDFPRTRMPSHVKTYDGSGDPEDHLKLFQSAVKTQRWAMPTWCHMFNSTLTGNARVWFDKLPKESIDSYDDLRATFRENYLQQTKQNTSRIRWNTSYKQRDGKSTEDL